MSDLLKDWGNAGKSLTRGLADKLGEAAADSFRTAKVIVNGVTTTYETKGGKPQVTVTKPTVATQCTVFPIKEMTLAGDETQDERLYYHDHDADQDTPAKLYFSADGILSVRVTPLMRLRLKSIKLAKAITVWLNDHSGADASTTQVGTATHADFDAVVPGIKAVEKLKRSAPDSPLLREYHPKTYIPNPTGSVEDLFGLGYLFKRLKKIVFDISGAPPTTRFSVLFGNYDLATAKDVSPQSRGDGRAVETKVGKREFHTAGIEGEKHKVKTIKFNVVDTLTIATPGGVLEPLHHASTDTLHPLQYTGVAEEIRPLTSCADISAFGQVWHGYREDTANGSGTRILWDSIDRNYRILTHNTDPEAGPVIDLALVQPTPYEQYYNFDLPEVDSEGVGLPQNASFKNYAIFNGGRLGPLSSAPQLITYTDVSGVFDILYRDPTGIIWNINLVTGFLQGTGIYRCVVKVTGRVDNFLETKTPCDIQIADFLVAEMVVDSAPPRVVVKNSPDGKSAALIGYSPTQLEVPNGYKILNFSGTGSLVTATYGQGIACTQAGPTTWLEDGPLGKIYVQDYWSAASEDGEVKPTTTSPALSWRNIIPSYLVSYTGSGPDAVSVYSSTDELFTNTMSRYIEQHEDYSWLVDIVFDADVLGWKRIDYHRDRTSSYTETYTGFLGQVETVSTFWVGGSSSVATPPGPYLGTLTQVDTADYKFYYTGVDVGMISGRYTRTEVRSMSSGSLTGSTSSESSSGVTDSANVVKVTIGDRGYGMPVVGRSLFNVMTSEYSPMIYEGVVSSFPGTPSVRFAYDPHNKTLHQLDSTTYGTFV